MECAKCGTDMLSAQFCTGGIGVPPYLMRKRPSVFEPEHRRGVDCFVCLVCGAVELRAQDVKKLLLD